MATIESETTTLAPDAYDKTRSLSNLIEALFDTESVQKRTWLMTEDHTTGARFVDIDGKLFRVGGSDSIGGGFALNPLGANYERVCGQGIRAFPRPLQQLLAGNGYSPKFFLLTVRRANPVSQAIPLATFLEDALGDMHLLNALREDHPGFWPVFASGVQALLDRTPDASRYDTYGDFLPPGAPSVVQRHSTERLRRTLPKTLHYDRRLCTHCLQCATLCTEMRSLVSNQGTFLLGPSSDFCTHCGMCQRRCPYLLTEPGTPRPSAASSRAPLADGGSGVFLYGKAAQRFRQFLAEASTEGGAGGACSVVQSWRAPSDHTSAPVSAQFLLSGRDGRRPVLISAFDDLEGEPAVLARPHYRALVMIQTTDGAIEKELISEAMKAGLDVACAAEPSRHQVVPPANEATRWFSRLHRTLWMGRSALSLWKDRQVDLLLAPWADRLSPELHQEVLRETGRLSQILSPAIPQALPLTRSPLLGRLTRELARIFEASPELRDAEASVAAELLRDIPRNSAAIHGRYRPMAFAGGHSACPSCVEMQVLAIPVYMAIAMSLARGELPQVTFTCETGCMSETLNKTGEVAQKVPGGRTVFGGGFAFGEAIALAQDRAVRCGLLPKGRRYVVSQGGDGGAVIGLPAWLNALRQQSYLIRQRYSNALHFINITDTQVYSNTGGESSASSLVGMGTLTTPVGRFLLGNQRIQWNLVNLAAEFPNILVGTGHSANRTAMQQFWNLADQLGQSAIRWDVTPCPETGKFFGEDPDDLAEIMAHAGMIPEVVFFGRFRKRIAPFHPGDRRKPYREWHRQPKPITYWLHRDPRYQALFRKNAESGAKEPVNLTAHFLITQLESYRDQINRQIDLETHIVRQAEQWVSSLFQELRDSWLQYRYRPEQFRYAMLFNSAGELKPQYAASLEREMVIRVLGWDELSVYASRQEHAIKSQADRIEQFLAELTQLDAWMAEAASRPDEWFRDESAPMNRFEDIRAAGQSLRAELQELNRRLKAEEGTDPLERELFPEDGGRPLSRFEERRADLYRMLDRILEERALATFAELQQHRLSRQLNSEFLRSGGIIREPDAAPASAARRLLLERIAAMGPFSIGVASLAGDRGIAVNRIFANFFILRGAWAGMAWQFGSSKRGTPVLSATFVDSRPIQRKDAMLSLPTAVLTVTNFEETKRQPDIFFSQLMPEGFLIINHHKDAEDLWQELVRAYPQEIRDLVLKLRGNHTDEVVDGRKSLGNLFDEISRNLYRKSGADLDETERGLVRKVAAAVSARVVTVDMDGIVREAAGSSGIVSNLVAVAPIHQALCRLGLPFDWEEDLPLLVKGFPAAVLKNPRLLDIYYRAMESARSSLEPFFQAGPTPKSEPLPPEAPASVRLQTGVAEDDPSRYLMIMGGTLAGMVLSQIAIPSSPLFYIGFPITPAGNPFYAMAEAYANGHPYVVVDEVNPSEKVAAEKLLGIARNGGFLPVTFTASQGWRLFTEIVPQFVGARLEGLFLLAKRALAAPNLNIEESHTDFMSFRDDGGIMLAPKSIQEYVPALYLSRLLTHFAKLPVILSIGGITDTHKIGLVKVPSDERVRAWLETALKGFDFWEQKIINRQEEFIVHGPSGTSAVYQETQSELEKAHQAVVRVLPYALRAVEELTGVVLDELEVTAREPGESSRTLLILQGSLYPNAVEALEELEAQGWTGMACMSLRFFNPFPEEKLSRWLEQAERIVILDRSSSFGSIPPLASRVLTTLARFQSAGGASRPRQIRVLVGGLGGREITVAQMQDILLSTHLLFHPVENWEKPLIEAWLDGTDPLQAILEEAAAFELRNTDRHTRVPSSQRRETDRQREFDGHLETLKSYLREKQYGRFLANYNQVEFVGAREVLGESALLRQIVTRLELHLARKATETGRPSWRHPLVLLNYSRDPEDHRKAKELFKHLDDSPRLTGRLKMTFGIGEGVTVSAGPPSCPGGRTEQTAPTEAPTELSANPETPSRDHPVVVFTEDEAEAIQVALTEMVKTCTLKPRFFNPEDYEHELIRTLSTNPASILAQNRREASEETFRELAAAYLDCYREVIDGTLQREILTLNHAPELRELFEGDGRRLLVELVNDLCRDLANEQGSLREMVAKELERYLMERRFPHYPLPPSFYLEYFRTWILGDLIAGL